MTELLRTTQITKAFPGVVALDGVDLTVNSGEVLALLGENGAGKSTLMKILAGVQPPDSGSIHVDGTEVTINDPLMSKKLGIGIVFQELSLADNMTVAENIFALNEPMRGPFVDSRAMYRQAQELLDRLGFDVDPRAMVGDLSVSSQQLVEIAKVLRAQPRVLILDEPTSTLTEREVQALFAVVNRVKAEGTGVVYISHKMDEIHALCDRATVLRDGAVVGGAKLADTTVDELVKMMVGRPLEQSFPPQRPVDADAPTVLELNGFTRAGRFEDIDLTVRAGEIVGIYGLVGAGRTELAHGIFGVTPATSGTMRLHGTELRIGSPSEAVAHGIAYATEDRKSEGLVLDASVAHNTTMANLGAISRALGFLSFRQEKDITRAAVESFRVKTPTITHAVGTLSGGNQQKIVLAKWLETAPKVLLLDEPTRGIDVGAKYEIYLLMQKLAEQGVAIVMISSELPEVLGMAHRVLVMNDHRIIAEVDPASSDAESIMSHITGGSQ
ncbi:sugar ABC transporter ATP-binding protein [Cellulomonas sp. NPDC089187]|uniref:sugar ABC transporter ATP-binding protein n=1 Tax=Cellulomonas sp. NPDC089187 TaxID=3154970 RepID=UPI0034492EA4